MVSPDLYGYTKNPNQRKTLRKTQIYDNQLKEH